MREVRNQEGSNDKDVESLQRTRSSRDYSAYSSHKAGLNNESPHLRNNSFTEERDLHEGSFYELMARDAEECKSNKGTRTLSFRRRRSLDSRPHSREFKTADFHKINGSAIQPQELNNLRPKSPLGLEEKVDPQISVNHVSGNDYVALPTIVVDNSNREDNDSQPPSETDRLLDSGVISGGPTGHSTKVLDFSPDIYPGIFSPEDNGVAHVRKSPLKRTESVI